MAKPMSDRFKKRFPEIVKLVEGLPCNSRGWYPCPCGTWSLSPTTHPENVGMLPELEAALKDPQEIPRLLVDTVPRSFMHGWLTYALTKT